MRERARLPSRWARRPISRLPRSLDSARVLQAQGAVDTDLFVYELRFAERTALTRAFDRVDADPAVASCSFEVVPRRLRMLARREVADRIVERLYLEGGLAWCSRHHFESPSAA